MDVSSGLLCFIGGRTVDSTDKMTTCEVYFGFFIKTSRQCLQSVMNDHLNDLGIYTDLPKVRSVVMLHSLCRANKNISGWLTLNMET